MKDPTLKMAQGLRRWQEKHPFIDTGIGFVPGVGQVYGLASTAATMRDPEASGVEKGLAAAGILPIGKVAGKLRKITIGEKAMSRDPILAESLRKAKEKYNSYPDPTVASVTRGPKGATELIKGDPRINDELFREFEIWRDPDSGKFLTELDDSMVMPDFGKMRAAGPKKVMVGNVPVTTSKQELTHAEAFPHARLHELLPELKANKVTLDPKRARDTGGHYSDTGEIIMGTVPDRLRFEDARDLRHVLTHETRHEIARQEGMSTGANISNKIAALKLQGKGPESPEYQAAWREYKRNPGELAAEVDAQRRNMTVAGRRALPYHRHLEEERARTYHPDFMTAVKRGQQARTAELLRKYGADPTDHLIMVPGP